MCVVNCMLFFVCCLLRCVCSASCAVCCVLCLDWCVLFVVCVCLYGVLNVMFVGRCLPVANCRLSVIGCA